MYRYRRFSRPDPWFLFWSALCWLNTKVYRGGGSYIDWEWLDFVVKNFFEFKKRWKNYLKKFFLKVIRTRFKNFFLFIFLNKL